ncbi:hypothetical protein FSBG_00083 [Fusobacterium gonidiaformans 3-1-5R]|uniref:SpoVT-AbrB domain-containing protein n=1 Tax=Fusobacterium gonidiaformans 3-1-5R TaxID=469605 RepID=E5BEQ5_9FUSO|nr:hypothetical protein [Fusobacterium gonidiaformans]EFS20586.1 hypothetical protein FSBG_00083 [Fusobacterium gonidiaformans 3-1-5R]MCF0163294.1 hypothetical protein [Fusobacterium necrophorum]
MEKRNAKISFSRSGNGIGAKLPLSVPLLKKFGIGVDEREVEIIYDEEQQTITVKKKK